MNHVELTQPSRGSELPESFWAEPMMYQGGSDTFLDPRGTIPLGDAAWGLDSKGMAVIVDDVPSGASVEVARDAIRLVMLVNDVSLRCAGRRTSQGIWVLQRQAVIGLSP